MNVVYKIIYPILALIILGLAIFLGVIYFQEEPQSENTPTQTSQRENIRTYTLEEVERANDIQSRCLIAYDGKVYDIPTSYPEEHPGGAAAVSNSCGKDITNAFQNAHSNLNSAIEELNNYFVGELQD